MSVADIVSRLIAAGTPPDVAAMAVTEAFAAGASSGSPRQSVDPAADRRRASDRDRKRQTRDQRLPENEWIQLVSLVLKRDRSCCQYCGSDKELTADHVHPVSRGGSHETNNLVACCLTCNRKKSNKFLVEWLPDPQTSAGQNFVSDPARSIILRETSAEVCRSLPTTEPALTLKDNLKEEKKVRAAKGRIPADWNPNAAHFEAAEKLKIPRAAVEAKAEDMRIWAGSTGALKVDWDLTFHGFLRRDAPKLAVQSVGAVMATLTVKSPNWNIWKAHYRDTGQQSKAAMMDRFASEDRPMTFPTELPEQPSTAH